MLSCRGSPLLLYFNLLDEIRNDLRNVLVNAKELNKEYLVNKGNKQFHHLHIDSKIIMNNDGIDKQILLMSREV
jgi:hypothetical protein